MPNRRVLIIDDEEGIRSSLRLILEDEDYYVRTAAGPDAALELAQQDDFEIVLCDVRMPGRSGLDLLPDLLRLLPAANIVVMSAYGDVDQALEAVRRGAYDYLAKPFQAQELLLMLRKAEERERLRQENQRLRQELGKGQATQTLVAVSPSMKEIHSQLEQAAAYKTTVLITGESGVGKEVVARAVHEMSERATQPFLAVNCGAIPESLIESELFGYCRGAFTGAEAGKPGLFREADGGTLFLDEIGELPASTQVTLLRTLQEEEVRPVGETKSVRIDVRILAATSRNLERDVEAGRFRADLYYRLNVFQIQIPPLRDRPEDIPVLSSELLEALSRRIGKSVRPIDSELMESLCAYPWPGNVRELENALERALILCAEDRLTPDLFPFAARALLRPGTRSSASAGDLSIKRQTRMIEERLIRRALQETCGNRSQAARILEISPRALQYKIKEYRIDPLNPASSGSDSD